MPPAHYVHDDEATFDDDEETISICSSVFSEETLNVFPQTRPVVEQRPARCGGLARSLKRSDGREAVLSPTRSPIRHAATPQLSSGSGSGMLLSSPRARELRRRRPVNNNSSSFKPPIRTPLVSQGEDCSSTLDDEDNKSGVTPDHAPACPSRARSNDQKNWPTLIPN